MYIIVSKEVSNEKMYLGWQKPVYEDDGYFWTFKDVINEILMAGDNTKEHPFLFNNKKDAENLAKKINLESYDIEYFGSLKTIFIYEKDGRKEIEVQDISADITYSDLEKIAKDKGAIECYTGCLPVITQ